MMKKLLPLLLICSCVIALHAAPDYPAKPVTFTDVRITGGMLQSRQATNSAVTLPFALGQCESSKRMTNFDLAAETMRRRAAGETNFQNRPPTQYPFDDSDAYKVLEGAAFCLSVQPNLEVAAQLEAMIKRISAAQEPDGYLYTYRTMHPDSPAHDWVDQKRWLKDPQLSHELYNLGHLYEAGVAHFKATGSRSLLDVCLKSAELVQNDFGDGKLRIAPGHQVIEMGLAKLYRQTGDPRWIELAKIFIEARGTGNEYAQSHKPVVQQTEAVGHAVRANYLYSGMADVATLTGDRRYLDAITAIWENVVGKKLHLTGGCGAHADGEAYGNNYDLPNPCYNETCAAVAFLFWNHRMFLMTGDAKYMDVFERSLYNGVLSGVSLSGDRFFYPNPLEYDGKAVNNHGFAGRAPWFGCACCPPNILRTLASLGGYLAAVQSDKLFVNLYAQSEISATVAGNKVRLEQTTSYPWDGAVTLRVKPEKPGRFSLCLRIPGWVQGNPLPSDLYAYDDPTPAKWSLRVNGEVLEVKSQQGYAVIQRDWKDGDTVTLDLPMPVRRVAGNAKIAATRGLVALERGPIVYAFEGVDNNGSVFDSVLPATASVTTEYRSELLGGVTVLKVAGAQKAARQKNGDVVTVPANLIAIPYATWANRGLTPMAVWVARDAAQARVAPKPRHAKEHDYQRWEGEIAAFEQRDRTNAAPKGAVLFIGSSTIRMWKSLAQDFPQVPVINRGFGGSQIVDSTHFAERIIFPYAPRAIFLRAGGNDINAGKSPEQVFEDFKQFAAKVQNKLPNTDIFYISLCPAIARLKDVEKTRALDAMVAEYVKGKPHLNYIETHSMSLDAAGQPRPELFLEDKLHFNDAGYQLLAERVRPYLPK